MKQQKMEILKTTRRQTKMQSNNDACLCVRFFLILIDFHKFCGIFTVFTYRPGSLLPLISLHICLLNVFAEFSRPALTVVPTVARTSGRSAGPPLANHRPRSTLLLRTRPVVDVQTCLSVTANQLEVQRSKFGSLWTAGGTEHGCRPEYLRNMDVRKYVINVAGCQ